MAPVLSAPSLPGDARRPRTLFIACGALAHEIIALKAATGWQQLEVTCLPAHWHNRPERIAPAVRARIRGIGRNFDRVFVIYGDCGTGGELDRVLREEGVERIPGPHCYHFLMGPGEFDRTHDADPGCFYLTDYLVRHFERIVVTGLGIDRHPELLPVYFGNYTTLVYIAQTDDATLRGKASAAADRLGLAFDFRYRGYGELGEFVHAAREQGHTTWPN